MCGAGSRELFFETISFRLAKGNRVVIVCQMNKNSRRDKTLQPGFTARADWRRSTIPVVGIRSMMAFMYLKIFNECSRNHSTRVLFLKMRV